MQNLKKQNIKARKLVIARDEGIASGEMGEGIKRYKLPVIK